MEKYLNVLIGIDIFLFVLFLGISAKVFYLKYLKNK